MEFIDLKKQYQVLKPQIDKNIEEVLTNASFIMGESVEIFEKRLAEYVGMNYCVSCSDGTAALQLIYMLKGIGKGDVVFCPDMTFIASVEPACMLGATPVFCDIDFKTYNINPESLEKQILAVKKEGKLNPKAVVAVDFLGNPADYAEITEIAKKHGLVLIEDAAQGMGGGINGRRCCSFGDIASTSFFPSKPLGCYGDGGAVFTNSEDEAKILKSLRVHGKGKTKYDNVRIGINSRLDTIQAAVLLAKLDALPTEIEKRQIVAKRYSSGLKDIVQCPFVKDGYVSSYAQYAIIVESEEKRDSLVKKLNENGVPTILYYPTPMHNLPVFQGVNNYEETFENATMYSKCSLGIPFSPYLTEEDQDKVIGVIKDMFYKY